MLPLQPTILELGYQKCLLTFLATTLFLRRPTCFHRRCIFALDADSTACFLGAAFIAADFLGADLGFARRAF